MNATPFQIGAALLAVGVILAPLLSPAVTRVRAFVASLLALRKPEAAGVTETDMHTVLELAARLKAVGCTEGVSLCQELLDVFLSTKERAE